MRIIRPCSIAVSRGRRRATPAIGCGRAVPRLLGWRSSLAKQLLAKQIDSRVASQPSSAWPESGSLATPVESTTETPWDTPVLSAAAPILAPAAVDFGVEWDHACAPLPEGVD